MKINPNIFRAYDIRGIYPQEINEAVVYKVGKALFKLLKPKKIVVGRDARLSSPALRDALVKGLTESGINVVDIGLSTTPMLYFGVNFLNADGGVEISASHNPGEYNGLKIVRERAIPISGETGIGQIRDLLLDSTSLAQKSKSQGRLILKDIKKEYINFLTKEVKAPLTLPGKIVVDAGNGMAGLLLDDILKKLNMQYFPLYFEPDCTFPHHEANPLKEETLQDLKGKMREIGANLGVAFDGDGDRVAFLDEKGKVVSASYLTALIARQILKEKGPGTILYDLRLSRIVPEVVKEWGGKALKIRVGHSFIKQKMQEVKALFAGELSGHFYFPFQFPQGISYFESGIFAMIKIFEIISREEKPLSELILPFQRYYHSGEINFELKNKEEALKKLAEIYKDAKLSYLDGLTVEYSDWWFNLRPSNTEPLLRLNLEAKTKDLMEAKLEEIKKAIKSRIND